MRYLHGLIVLCVLLFPSACIAQAGYSSGVLPSDGPLPVHMPDAVPGGEHNGEISRAYTFRSRADSLEWERERARAARSRGFRLVVDLFERQLFAIRGSDTLRAASIAVGMADSVLAFEGQRWRFDTPRGVRRVLGKDEAPIWIPPDWHYVEVAAELGLEIARLHPTQAVPLSDGRRLVVRQRRVGLLEGAQFEPLPRNEQIIFDGKLFIPPFGTENRQIEGELGRFRLDLGNGYLIHGTPHEYTIGDAATHGCIRLFDDDIDWMYRNVPVGTAVYIY